MIKCANFIAFQDEIIYLFVLYNERVTAKMLILTLFFTELQSKFSVLVNCHFSTTESFLSVLRFYKRKSLIIFCGSFLRYTFLTFQYY